MKGSSLALLLAPKKGGGDDPGGNDSADEESSEDDYTAFAEAAFPDEDWTPERVKALKQFVMACVDQ